MILMLATLACSDYDLKRQEADEVFAPQIKVDPAVISYGDVPEGETASEQFDIMNIGNASLDINEIYIEGAASFTLLGDPPIGTLEPEQQVSVTVIYEALEGESSGYAVVVSDDESSPETRVELLAGVGVAELRVEPDPYDFGTVSVGSTANGTAELMNVGGADLTVSDLVITSGPFDAWVDAELPATIPAGGSLDLKYSFTPASNATSSAEVRITHDAGDGETIATVTGTGDADLPVAVCSVTPDEVEPLSVTAAWLGSASYDPGGLTLTQYNWTLTDRPSGSVAVMPAGTADRINFQPDLAGTYEAQLVVVNSAGLSSAPCTATLSVVPGEDLWVEMYWTLSNDDMDLHLLAPGGRMRSNTDCYYQNCTGSGLDWGVRGDPVDDPALDLDDIYGTGPENINIDEPESGTFTVVVHDYTGDNRNNSANDVTVKIYLNGTIAWEDTRSISGEDTDNYFATVSWPGGVVTGL